MAIKTVDRYLYETIAALRTQDARTSGIPETAVAARGLTKTQAALFMTVFNAFPDPRVEVSTDAHAVGEECTEDSSAALYELELRGLIADQGNGELIITELGNGALEQLISYNGHNPHLPAVNHHTVF